MYKQGDEISQTITGNAQVQTTKLAERFQNQVNVITTRALSFIINHRQHNKRACHSCIALQCRMLRSGGTAIWRYGRKDEPQTTVSLFRVRCYGTANRSPQLGQRATLLKGVMSVSVCQVRTGLRSLALIFFFCTSPYVLTSWMTCTHQVTDK